MRGWKIVEKMSASASECAWQVARRRYWQKKMIETKTRKKFFGVPTATLPMVSRLARLTGARVLLLVAEMTDEGYVVHLEGPWTDFPGASIEADTARMNAEIERWARRLPEQYFWTHKRFKTRPAGERSPY